MHPVFVEIGWLTIRWYGVMMALGFMAALMNWAYLGRKEGKDAAFCSDLLFWVMVSGIIGARIAYITANIQYFVQDPLEMLAVWRGGLIYYGGFLGAGIAIWLFARARHQSTAAMFDFTITSVPLSHSLGRIGCFLNGCCFGKPAPGWPGGVYPVQLMESAFNFALYLGLLAAYRNRRRDGRVLAIYLIIYPVGRFLLEFLRGDERVSVMGVSVAQMMSIVLFAAGVAIFVSSRTKTSRVDEGVRE